MAITINKDLLPVKAHFFLYYGGISPVILFASTFAKQLGFSAVIVGSIYTVLPLIGMGIKLIMAAFADKHKCHKRIILVLLLLLLISTSCINLIKPINKRIEAELIYNDSYTVKLCSEEATEKCIVSKIRSEFKVNQTVNCEMHCEVDYQFMESLCNEWNDTHHCDKFLEKNITKEQFVSSEIENLNITLSENSTFLVFPNETFEEIFQFHIDILPHEVKQDGRCLSILTTGEIKDMEKKENNFIPPQFEAVKIFICQMICENPVITDTGKPVKENTLSQIEFWLFVLIIGSCMAGSGTITCLGETICFGLLGDKPGQFGKQRLWGSLGWGIMSLIGGALVDFISGDKAKKDYRGAFYTSATLIVFDIIAASRIKDTKISKGESKSIIWDIGKLFTNVRVIIYIMWCIFMGMSNGLIAGFLFWHLEDLTTCEGLENIKTLEGLYVTLQSFCGELPFFFLNAWMLKRIGHINAMSFTLFAFGTIFMLFSILNRPVYFLPISFLNGITFSTMYATMTSYASIISPPGTEATMQGLVGSLYEGLGISFGSFIAGLLMHYFKGAKVFRLYGGASLILCILHIIIQFFLQRQENPQNEKERKMVKYSSPEHSVQITNRAEKT